MTPDVMKGIEPLSVAVIGASGFFGRAIASALGTRCVCRTYYRHPIPDGTRFDALTMRLEDVLPPRRAVTHVIFCQAETGIDACTADPWGTFTLNVSSQVALIKEAVALGIRPVICSSEYVFDGVRGEYSEQDTPNPTTTYGTQKRELERFTQTHAHAGLILRLGKLYALDHGLVKDWRLSVGTIRCATDQRFSPLQVDDAAAMIVRLLERGAFGVYHLAGPEAMSRWQMLTTCLAAWRGTWSVQPCRLADLPFLEPRPLDLSLNGIRAMKDSGIMPRTVAEVLTQEAPYGASV